MKGVRRPTRPLRPGDSVRLVRTGLGNSFPEWDEVREKIAQIGLILDLGRDPDPTFAPYADSDKSRVSEFLSALTSGEEAAILSYRGGSGSVRLLCEWEDPSNGMGPSVPVVCGFSDMTFLHAALARKLSLATFWGPNARELRDPETFTLWWAMLSGTLSSGDFLPVGTSRSLRAGQASGPILGGNLESLAHLCGTPFLPDFSGAILLVEDIDEPLYAIDRAFRTLALSGVLKGLSGVVVGPFTGISRREDDPSSSVAELILALVKDIPVMEASLPGHGKTLSTWPLNVAVEMHCPPTGSPSLRLLEDPFEDQSRSS